MAGGLAWEEGGGERRGFGWEVGLRAPKGEGLGEGPRREGPEPRKGPEGRVVEGWSPEGWSPQVGPERWEPIFFRFFPSSTTFFFLSSLSWRSSRGILVVFGAPGGLECARLEFSGCCVKPLCQVSHDRPRAQTWMDI